MAINGALGATVNFVGACDVAEACWAFVIEPTIQRTSHPILNLQEARGARMTGSGSDFIMPCRGGRQKQRNDLGAKP